MLGKYDFSIVGPVENVRYLVSDEWPCEIQLTNGDAENEIKPHAYHPSKNARMCKFAERCPSSNKDVQLYGSLQFGYTNVVGIEYAV